MRQQELEALEHLITLCRMCPRLVNWRERVAKEKVRRFQDQEYWGRPIPAFGDPAARLLIVGLAPAAHGGNRTGRIFTGDRSGDWLYDALYRFGFANQPVSRDRDDGLQLRDCLVTAAIRCAPPENKPLPEEFENCRPYLREEMRLASRVRVTVALGQIAFRTFLKALRENGQPLPDRVPKFRHAGETRLPGGVVLISSYHPSQQNTQTGKLTHSMFDRIFQRAREILETE
jgi:uracil-DNA glycosylase